MNKSEASGPDMGATMAKELKALKKERAQLERERARHLRALGSNLKKIRAGAAKDRKRYFKFYQRALDEIDAAEKVAAKPIEKELGRLQGGKGKSERLEAVAHRIAILEGRAQ
jgi:hypothetical protein